MKQLNLVIHNDKGLHARPAKALVKLAKQFQSSISIQQGDVKVNAKSMIGLLKLGVEQASEVTFIIDGEDEEEAAQQIKTAVATGLGEALPASEPEKKPMPSEPTAQKPALKENELQGIPASPGIVIGPIFQLKRQTIVEERPFLGVAEEKSALKEALKRSESTILKMKDDAQEMLSAEEAEIFYAHLEILNDPEFRHHAEERIERGQTAVGAWKKVIDEQATAVASLSDVTLAARSADIRDVGQQVLRHLGGGPKQVTWPKQPFVLAADDLTPSETLALDRDKVLGFCTSAGGPTAHAAILARALKIPAVVSLGKPVLELPNDTVIILDGKTGKLEYNPSNEAIAAAEEAIERYQAKIAEDAANAATLAVTNDGHRVEVVANVGSPEEAHLAYQNGAEGIGLLRTEFLFLGQNEPPSETKQFVIYREIVTAMQNQPVIIRTLDIGGDKPVPYIQVEHEANPFLGERGIRLCLNRPELFKTQLRAIARASEFGRVLIMFPMVSDVTELIQARQMVDDVAAEQKAADVQIGMMIEVPAAAMMADKFAPHLDFFSIGTNDLTQYTLAIDRQHPSLARLSDGLHPAVLRLIDLTVKAAHQEGKWVGVCGELAADEQAVPILIGLGVDELSVNLNSIASLKAQVRQTSLAESTQLAQKALECATAAQVRALQ